MVDAHPMAAVQHIFVLMLENRSFDHMCALSGIPGIQAATSADMNSFDGVPYHFGGGAPQRMPSDPNHGFCEVVTQLAGKGTPCRPAIPYPQRTNAGFVADYATTTVRSGLLGRKRPLPKGDRGKVMLGIDMAVDSPALYALATHYALCDQWYSSLPGPTWPNRFFVHGASSDGLADAPALTDIVKWEALKGFVYPHGSIYDRLGAGNYRLYQDKSGPLSGRIPQVAALKGIGYFEVHGLDRFERDVASGAVAPYTFIEPAYGDIVSDSYLGGSSQHPLDGLAGGDRLVARVYRAIRNSPVWESSLLIVTYDEHGGFYDSGIPARSAPPPGDGTGPHQNPYGFDFSVYGVRVPAVIVSPRIARGTVDHGLYDHASVLATVERRFGLEPLTARDARAADLAHLPAGPLRPDGDCPRELPERAEPPIPAAAVARAAASPDEPISADFRPFLYVAQAAHREMVGDLVGLARLQPVATKGAAQLYVDEVVPQLEAAREAGRGA